MYLEEFLGHAVVLLRSLFKRTSYWKRSWLLMLPLQVCDGAYPEVTLLVGWPQPVSEHCGNGKVGLFLPKAGPCIRQSLYKESPSAQPRLAEMCCSLKLSYSVLLYLSFHRCQACNCSGRPVHHLLLSYFTFTDISPIKLLHI